MMEGSIEKVIGYEVLRFRSNGWKVIALREAPLPSSVYPYAAKVQAWTVLLMKRYHELGELPAWVDSGDQETITHNYELLQETWQEAGKIFAMYQMDIALYATELERWLIYPCNPVGAPYLTPGETLRFHPQLPAALPVLDDEEEEEENDDFDDNGRYW